MAQRLPAAQRLRRGVLVELDHRDGEQVGERRVARTSRSISGAQPLSTAKRWVRLRVSGSTIQVKTWLDGQAEPTAWNATVTDTTVTAPGQLFFSLARGSTNTGTKTVLIDDLTVKDAS